MYSEAIGLGLTVFQYRNQLSDNIKKFRYWLIHGRLRIVMFGPGGSGKSTLGLLLSGELNIGKGGSKYRESFDVETKKLKGGIPCSIIIGPGQDRRIISRWPELYSSLAEGKSKGVINVVSYGYHSFAGLGYKELKTYKKGMTKKQFLDKFLEEERNEEINIISNLTPRLIDAKEKIWMITLVTKQDLWWKERKEVERFYCKGEYDKYIKEITSQRGEKNFKHEYASASLVMANYLTGDNELLAPTTSGYDQNLQNSNLGAFLVLMKDFIESSNKK